MSDKYEKAEMAAAAGSSCAAAGCFLYLGIIALIFFILAIGALVYTFATGQGGLY
jgi:hypothetical protein